MPNDYKIIQSKTSDRKPLNLRISPITIKSWFFENKTTDGLTILYSKNEIASPIKIECVSSQHPLQALLCFRGTKRHDDSKKGHCLCSK